MTSRRTGAAGQRVLVASLERQHFFHPNDIGALFAGNQEQGLARNADSSLTIHVGAKSPGADREANWLPAPEGAFWLYIRAY